VKTTRDEMSWFPVNAANEIKKSFLQNNVAFSDIIATWWSQKHRYYVTDCSFTTLQSDNDENSSSASFRNLRGISRLINPSSRHIIYSHVQTIA